MDIRCPWLPTTLKMDSRKMLECWLIAVLSCLPLLLQLRIPTVLFLPNLLLWNVFLHCLLLVIGTILSFPFLLQSILPPPILSNLDSWSPLYKYFMLFFWLHIIQITQVTLDVTMSSVLSMNYLHQNTLIMLLYTPLSPTRKGQNLRLSFSPPSVA